MDGLTGACRAEQKLPVAVGDRGKVLDQAVDDERRQRHRAVLVILRSVTRKVVASRMPSAPVRTPAARTTFTAISDLLP